MTCCNCSEEEEATELLLSLVLTHHILAAGYDIPKDAQVSRDVPNAVKCLTAQIHRLELRQKSEFSSP